jgi:transcriptional regulator with XRE-family HTH domain
MSGRRNWSEIRRVGTSEAEARIAAYRRANRAILRLAQAREERGVTQEELARALDVGQAHVSRVEHRTNLLLSTVYDYVAALGGELHLQAVFPDGQQIDLGPVSDDEPDCAEETASSRIGATTL